MILATAFLGYHEEQLKDYIESVNECGFSGRKIVIYYNPEEPVQKYLESNGWEVFTFPLIYNINFQRRIDFSNLVDILGLDDMVCFTDMGDVVFRKDPSYINLDLYLGADVFIPHHEHEWAKKYISEGYPDVYDKIKNRLHLNAGIVIGKSNIISELFKKMSELVFNGPYSEEIKTGKWYPVDQISMNVAVYKYFYNILTYPKVDDRYVLNMAHIHSRKGKDLSGYTIYHQEYRMND